MKNKIGIVLSGGGYRGVAHIGVIKLLEELDITPSFVAGTSAGSIVGAFYAAGYPSGDILKFFTDTNLFSIRNFVANRTGIIDPAGFKNKFKKFFPDDRFGAMEKKLFIAATNITNPKLRIFQSGSVIDAVLASSAVPFIFAPVQIGNHLYSDGGILNNFPIEPLQENCNAIIGVHVNPLHALQKEDISNIFSVSERAFFMSINATSLHKYDQCDVFIEPPSLYKYGIFDYKKTEEIFEAGYKEALKLSKELSTLKQNSL